MRAILRALGVLALVAASLLALAGVAAWPPGGLAFAAPYLFLLPAIPLGLGGALLLLLARPRPPADPGS